jgi:hypothetical protein
MTFAAPNFRASAGDAIRDVPKDSRVTFGLDHETKVMMEPQPSGPKMLDGLQDSPKCCFRELPRVCPLG